MTKQGLIHHHAGCLECDKACDARNALAWAHNHCRTTGHAVELQLGYRISNDDVAVTAGDRAEPPKAGGVMTDPFQRQPS